MMRLAQTCALWTLLLGPDAIMKHHASDMNEATMNSAPRYAFQYGEVWRGMVAATPLFTVLRVHWLDWHTAYTA